MDMKKEYQFSEKLDDSKVPESDYATRKQQLAQSELDKFDVSRGFYRDNHGNLRDLRELSLDDELYNPNQIADHPAVTLLKGLDADYDGVSIPLRKPSRAEKSVSKYRNVMNGLIARTSKK